MCALCRFIGMTVCAGKIGTVKRVIRYQNRLIIKGINYIRLQQRSTDKRKAGIFLREAPVHYSNVALVDPSTGKPTKISRQYLADGTKVRVAKKTGTVIPKPDILIPKRKRDNFNAISDTPANIVLKKTYVSPAWIESLKAELKAERDAKRAARLAAAASAPPQEEAQAASA